MTNHTPGPWRVVKKSDYFAIYTGPIGRNEAGCQIADTNHENAGNQEANAALIARAPDLLAENSKLKGQLEEAVGALEYFINEVEGNEDGMDNLLTAFDKARALLSKLKEAGS